MLCIIQHQPRPQNKVEKIIRSFLKFCCPPTITHPKNKFWLFTVLYYVVVPSVFKKHARIITLSQLPSHGRKKIKCKLILSIRKIDINQYYCSYYIFVLNFSLGWSKKRYTLLDTIPLCGCSNTGSLKTSDYTVKNQ